MAVVRHFIGLRYDKDTLGLMDDGFEVLERSGSKPDPAPASEKQSFFQRLFGG